MEGSGFKKTMEKTFERAEKMWNFYIKPELNTATLVISARVAAKTKNPQSAQTTSNILKLLTRGKILSLTDMHGQGLRLRVR